MDDSLIGREDALSRLRTISDPDGPAVVVLRGRPGVGKSRLLDALAAELDDVTTTRVFGSAPVARVPFGAVTHLLDLDTLPDDPTTLFAHVRRMLAGNPASGPTVLLVDDAHELDSGTVGVIHQLGAHGQARVVLVVRDRPGVPQGLTDLAGDPAAVQIELDPLSSDATHRLVEDLVGRSVDRAWSDRVWRHTSGLPLFVVVLVRSSADAEILDEVDGLVGAAGDLPLASLHELVLTRMRSLEAEARIAVDVAALSGGMPPDAIGAIAGRQGLETAIASGYLRTNEDGSVRVGHPVYGEAVLESMSRARRKELAGSIVDAFSQSGGQVDPVRLAVLSLDAGRPLSGIEASSAAVDAVARGDFGLGEVLALAALETDPTRTDARLTLARSMGFQRRGEEAVDILRGVTPENPTEAAELAIAHGHVLAFVLGRPDEATRLLEERAAELPDTLRGSLDADRALYGAMRGTFRDVVEAGERALANLPADDLAKVRAATNLILARVLLGRLDGFEELMREALELARRHRDRRPLAETQCELTEMSWLYMTGAVDRALAYAAARAGGDEDDVQLPHWDQWRGFCAAEVGDLDTAIRSQRRALTGYEQADPFRLRSMSVGMLAMHHAQSGRMRKSVDAMLEQAEREVGDETRLAVWVGRGRAWTVAVRGDLEPAASIAFDNGRRAAAGDHLTWAVLALHDAVRFGRPGRVRADLESCVADMSGAHLPALMRDHAGALDDRDADGLDRVAGRFLGFGAMPCAAEAWSQAAQVLDAAGNDSASRIAATRAAFVRRRYLEPVRTPAVAMAPEALTPRELDVAARALEGRSSREIAGSLYLSVRTVDNHLASVYRKLGLSGRDELMSVFEAIVASGSSGPQGV